MTAAPHFFSYFLISIPGFFFAYILIILVVRVFHVPVIGMETFGMGDAPWPNLFMDRIWHLLIPSLLAPRGASRSSPGMCAARCLKWKAKTMFEPPGPKGSRRIRSTTNMPSGMRCCPLLPCLD